jgi:hypothetical protein
MNCKINNINLSPDDGKSFNIVVTDPGRGMSIFMPISVKSEKIRCHISPRNKRSKSFRFVFTDR